MIIRLKYIVFISLFLFSQSAIATIDYVAVNHITKQIYYADTDNTPGFIGWTHIPEGKFKLYEQQYIARGFTFTTNPYLIEELIIILIIVLFLSRVIKYRLKKNE